MNSTILYISLCLILPIALLCFYLEKRARRIMISMILGVFSCILAYYINNASVKVFSINNIRYSMLIAPLVEEILKFACVLSFGNIVKKGKRGSTANAFAVGVGFCVVENFFYLITYINSANIYWIISRSIGTGLMHCMTASLYGISIYNAKNKIKGNMLLIFGILLCGITFHEIFNIFVQIDPLRIVGVLMPIIASFILFYLIKGSELHNYLMDNESHL